MTESIAKRFLYHGVWSFLGFAAAVVLFLIAPQYTSNFSPKPPRLLITTAAQTPVFDVREPVESLEVSYKGVDLGRQGKTLTIAEIEISNNGGTPITKSLYDDSDLPGIATKAAQIIRADIAHPTNDYLRRHVRIVATPREVRFQPIILEAGDRFVLRLLLLHFDKDRPTLFAIGKLAGMRRLTLSAQPTRPVQEPLWRTLLYSVFFGLLGFLSAHVGTEKVQEVRRRRKLQKLCIQKIEGFQRLFPQYYENVAALLGDLPTAASDRFASLQALLSKLRWIAQGGQACVATIEQWQPAQESCDLLIRLGLPIDGRKAEPEHLRRLSDALTKLADTPPAVPYDDAFRVAADTLARQAATSD